MMQCSCAITIWGQIQTRLQSNWPLPSIWMLAVVALLIMGVRQSSARHMTLDVLLVEADSVADRRIQLGGCVVVPGTIEWDEYHKGPVGVYDEYK